MRNNSRFYLVISLCLVMLIAGVGLTLPAGPSASAQAETKRWVVIYKQSFLPSNADAAVANAGGTVKSRLPEIGALAAESADPDFAAKLSRDAKVSDVVEDIRVKMIPGPNELNVQAVGESSAVEPPGDDTQTGSEPFYNAFQWDKKRMRASNQGSYAVQQGRPEVVVAVLDTGADILPTPHVDINNPATGTNFDVARSRSFINTPSPDGDPNPAAWDDRNGHGSWCLSAVGAPINGIGMSGVAPRVRLVALKVLDDNGDGSFVWLAQALIYAGNQKFDIASMSLSGILRHSNPSSQALIKLVHRAVNYARENGVTPFGSLGNDSFNVSDGDFFRDFIVVPAELSGVIGVSATGYFNLKASYSNYGVGKTDITAPGGDFGVQTPTNPTPQHRGSVLGAWATEACGFPNCYVFSSGTSMSTPNAAGVAALIISQYGDFTPDNSNKPHMSPQHVEAFLQQSANNQPCPEPREVNYFTVIPTTAGPIGTQVGLPDQRCQGDAGYNNFYGKGIVDALKAVTDRN
ncbi:MAG TPA: S8 family serine peptidase [Pyrinomonadaceae bacterium]|nr:S8 family serine peptidase [Pyrinomonadaceae bacterium]